METPACLIDVCSILEDLGGFIAFDAPVDLPVIELGDEVFKPLEPARVTASITNTGSGIVASGTVHAVFEAVCSRCLREFPLEMTVPLDGFYVQPGEDAELPEEQEVEYVAEGSIDLMGQILASLVLDLPFAPLHDPDCAGICPSCGADLVDGPCSCEPVRPDSPFAALKDLLPPDDEV